MKFRRYGPYPTVHHHRRVSHVKMLSGNIVERCRTSINDMYSMHCSCWEHDRDHVIDIGIDNKSILYPYVRRTNSVDILYLAYHSTTTTISERDIVQFIIKI